MYASILFRSLSRLLSLPVYRRMAFARRVSRTAPQRIMRASHNHRRDNKEGNGNGKDGDATNSCMEREQRPTIEDTAQ